MKAESQRPKGREDATSALNAAIKAVNLAEKTSSIPPAKTVFSSASALLTTIMVRFLPFCNDLHQVYIQPGLNGQ